MLLFHIVGNVFAYFSAISYFGSWKVSSSHFNWSLCFNIDMWTSEVTPFNSELQRIQFIKIIDKICVIKRITKDWYILKYFKESSRGEHGLKIHLFSCSGWVTQKHKPRPRCVWFNHQSGEDLSRWVMNASDWPLNMPTWHFWIPAINMSEKARVAALGACSHSSTKIQFSFQRSVLHCIMYLPHTAQRQD